jgi:hypothetical protein
MPLLLWHMMSGLSGLSAAAADYTVISSFFQAAVQTPSHLLPSTGPESGQGHAHAGQQGKKTGVGDVPHSMQEVRMVLQRPLAPPGTKSWHVQHVII